jgi:ABC-2 type transport system ATP-binding protein
VVLHELSPRRGSLEEAFMQLTGEAVEYHADASGSSGGEAGTGTPLVPAGK